MKSDFLKQTFVVTTLAITAVACAHRTADRTPSGDQPARVYKNNAANAPLKEIREESGNHVVSTVKFPVGKSELTPQAQAELERAIRLAKNTGDVDDITVAVWSDKQFPAKGESLPHDQVSLADKRGDAIENYIDKLDDKYDVGHVKIVNMAKEPSALSRYFKTDDAKMKQEIASASAGRTSAAMIIVRAK
jgi:outer membrane protein OmpA-like peptidoglycan-associated protein